MVSQTVAELRVEDVLRAYRGNQIQNQPYGADLVYVADKQYGALEPPQADFERFVAEMVVTSKRQRNPMVADIIARNSPRLWDAVRMVNANTKVGFGGGAARGDRLLFNPLEPRDFGSAGGFPGTTPPTTWYRSVTTVAGRRLWPDANTIDLTISSLPVLSHVIFGFTDPVAVPKPNIVQLVLDGDAWAEEGMDWEWREAYGDIETPVYELKNPWVIRPGASYRINVRDYITGDDRIIPIGFSVKRGRDIIASLAT
jgi:hypothetical protein